MEDKHDFCKAEAITRSMAVSILCTSLPRAIMSPGLDLSFLRCSGSVRTLEVGNAVPPGDEFVSTRSRTARLTTSCACSLRPSPPHLPRWQCHAKSLSGIDPGMSLSHRGAWQQLHVSCTTSYYINPEVTGYYVCLWLCLCALNIAKNVAVAITVGGTVGTTV